MAFPRGMLFLLTTQAPLPHGDVDDDAATGHHDEPVHQWQPAVEAVLGDHQGERAARDRVGDAVPDAGGGVGVEHGGRLIQQQQAVGSRERSGQADALALAARQRPHPVILGHRQPDASDQGADARPDRGAGNRPVLQPEGDVAADGLGDLPRARILEQERGTTAERFPVGDADLPGRLAGLGGVQDPGQGAQQRRLPAAARPGQQHPLAGFQGEVEVLQHRRPGPQRRPGQPPHHHRRRAALGHGVSLRAAYSAPGPNASRAPARARARTSAWPPSPASSTPESTENPSTANFHVQEYAAA